MQELRVETIPVEKLIPAEYNPRKDLKPGDKEYKLIQKSLDTHGYKSPIIWNEVTGRVVGGHQRLKILKAEGVKEADVVVVHLEDETDEMELNLLLNKARGRRDIPKLADLLEGLQLASYDMEATGLDIPTVDEIMSQAHSKDIHEDDFMPEPDPEIIAQKGDLWTLGKHRLLCEDGIDREQVELLMGGQKANTAVCRPLMKDGLDEVALKMSENMAEFLVAGGSAYVFHPDEYGDLFRQAFKDAGFHLSGVCIWQKWKASGKAPYHVQHEPVLFGWLNSGTHRWLAGRNRTTVWSWPDVKQDEEGVEVVPVSIAAQPIRNSTAPNGIVLDLFGGYGSSLLACEQTNRLCRMMENSPEYASAAIKRYMKMYPENEVFVERNGEKITISPNKTEKKQKKRR